MRQDRADNAVFNAQSRLWSEKEGKPQVAISGDSSKGVGTTSPGDCGAFQIERMVFPGTETVNWGLEMLSIPEEWQVTQGEDITIAVLDTGIVYSHPDFSKRARRVDPSKTCNFLESVFAGYEDFTHSKSGVGDLIGHGTHVAGILAARQDGEGVIGIAPMVKLLIGKVIGDDGKGFHKELKAGISWAIENGANIISMSLESDEYDKGVHDAIKEAVKAGIFVICAAGNNIKPGENNEMELNAVKYPAMYPETISVGAIDRRLKVARYSCSREDGVDFVAPGDEILSTYPPRTFACLSGTSMAAPFVSGVAALFLSYYNKNTGNDGNIEPLDKDKLIEHLRRVTIEMPSRGPKPDSEFGLINPDDLVNTDYTPLWTTILKIAAAVLAIGFIVYVLFKYVF